MKQQYFQKFLRFTVSLQTFRHPHVGLPPIVYHSVLVANEVSHSKRNDDVRFLVHIWNAEGKLLH